MLAKSGLLDEFGNLGDSVSVAASGARSLALTVRPARRAGCKGTSVLNRMTELGTPDSVAVVV